MQFPQGLQELITALCVTYSKTSKELRKVIHTVGNVQCSCQGVLWSRFQGLISHAYHAKHNFVGTFFQQILAVEAVSE